MKQILSVCLCFLIMCGFASAQEEWMPDPNLRQAVREALELPDEIPLTQATMLRLTVFNAISLGIKDLTGLEHATHLTWLNLGGNEIQDLSRLAGVPRLKGL